MAAPSKYRKIYEGIAYEMALLGATDQALADAIDVNVDTIYDWKKKYRGFSEALRRGKILADGKVANALYQRAIGFEYTEVTYEKIGSAENLQKESEELMISDVYKKKIVTKLLAPDPGAAMNWLKNRQPTLFRDKQVLEIDAIPDDQIDRLFAKLTNEANEQKEQKRDH
jgi:hypothetical protein